MKYLTLFSTLLAVAAAAPLAEVAEVQTIQDVQGVEVKEPSASLEPTQGVKILKKFSESPAKDGGQRIPISIGNWTVTSKKMISTFVAVTKTPCGKAGCYVTAMEATILYPDGKEANVDTGAWLHHIAMFGSGTGGGSIWACGNERPTLRLNNKKQFGIAWPKTFMMMVDLMTEVVTPKTLNLVVTFEVVPLSTPGYNGVEMYWLTLGQDQEAKDGAYSFNTQSMRVTKPGLLLYSIGHMHDGGTDMQLFVQDSMIAMPLAKPLCKSIMHYDAKPAAGAAPMEGMAMGAAHGHSRRDGHGGHGAPGDHITAPGACTDFGEVKVGEYLRATAQYNATEHPLMVHNGKREKLMGNMRVYVGVPK